MIARCHKYHKICRYPKLELIVVFDGDGTPMEGHGEMQSMIIDDCLEVEVIQAMGIQDRGFNRLDRMERW